MSDNGNHVDERTYLDPEVDQYYKQMNTPMQGIDNPLKGVGSVLLVVLTLVILILNINFLQFNR